MMGSTPILGTISSRQLELRRISEGRQILEQAVCSYRWRKRAEIV